MTEEQKAMSRIYNKRYRAKRKNLESGKSLNWYQKLKQKDPELAKKTLHENYLKNKNSLAYQKYLTTKKTETRIRNENQYRDTYLLNLEIRLQKIRSQGWSANEIYQMFERNNHKNILDLSRWEINIW